MKMYNLNVSSVCGEKCEKLNNTKWGHHSKKCNNKKNTKLTQISRFFKVKS